MENTIKNMELVLTKMGIELEIDGINQAKTLSNTYSALLKQYMYGINYNSLLPLAHVESLNWQHVIALQHFDRVNQMISNKLEETDYVAANNLSVVSDKLTRSSSDLKELIGKDTRIKNLPQNRNKEIEKVKQVTIFGKHAHSSNAKYGELKKQFMNEITSDGGTATTLVFHTKELRVTAVTYSDSFRGLRLDEIYVDKNLSIDNLNTIKSMKKDKNTPIHYF